jgi:hypothetical protein
MIGKYFVDVIGENEARVVLFAIFIKSADFFPVAVSQIRTFTQ